MIEKDFSIKTNYNKEKILDIISKNYKWDPTEEIIGKVYNDYAKISYGGLKGYMDFLSFITVTFNENDNTLVNISFNLYNKVIYFIMKCILISFFSISLIMFVIAIFGIHELIVISLSIQIMPISIYIIFRNNYKFMVRVVIDLENLLKGKIIAYPNYYKKYKNSIKANKFWW